MCRDLVDDPEEARKLVYRHLAWLTTLRYAMRQGRAWETVESPPNAEYLRAYRIPEKESSLESELARFLPRDEVAPILRASNAAGRVLSLQDQAIKDLLDRKLVREGAFAQMRAAVATMHARQCDSELIKDFPYPRQYAIVNTIFVRILCLLLPLAMINELGKLNLSVGGIMDGNMVWLAIPMSMLVSWMYTSLDQVGESTSNPFEGGANDVPISQICLEIEIGLKEMLGEVCDPMPDRTKHDILL
jgi:putative membrane protein